MPHLNAPSYLTSYLDQAVELEDRDEYEAALAVYRRALELYPNLAILHNNAGCCFANLERCTDAEQEFLRAIQLTPVNRQNEIEIPDSYPKEPEQNLRAVRARLKGTRGPLPGRATPRSFRFMKYFGLFVTTTPLGRMLTLMSAVIIIFLAITHSPYTEAFVVIAIVTIIVTASLAYVVEPHLRRASEDIERRHQAATDECLSEKQKALEKLIKLQGDDPECMCGHRRSQHSNGICDVCHCMGFSDLTNDLRPG